MKKKKSFAARLSLSILGATATVFILSMVGIGWLVVNAVTRESASKADAALATALSQIETKLVSVEASTKSFRIVAEGTTTREAFGIVDNFVRSNDLIMGSTIAFPGGKCAPYAYKNENGGVTTKYLEYDYSGSDWFTVSEPSWSEPYYDEGGAYVLMTTYSVPVSGGRIMTADVALSDITSTMKEVTLPYSSAYLFLLSKEGVPLSEVPDSSALSFAPKMKAGEKGIENFRSVKSRFTISYAPLPNGWSAAIVCPHKDIYYGVRVMNIILILISLIGFGIIYGADKFLIARLTKPLLEFTASKERFERETAIASSIQSHMVPHNFPHVDKLDVFASLIPAKEVGGDLYDFRVSGDDLYFAIGDVSGKGVPAALYMAITRAAFRFVTSNGVPMADAVGRINAAFCDGNETNMFVTLFAGKYNFHTRILEYCNAGHNPIVVVEPDGTPRFLKSKPNIAAGLFDAFTYEGETMELPEGSRLLLYTDGVTEAETSGKDQYGDSRLLEFAARCSADMSSECFVNDLVRSVREFTCGAQQNDDITVMSIRL